MRILVLHVQIVLIEYKVETVIVNMGNMMMELPLVKPVTINAFSVVMQPLV